MTLQLVEDIIMALHDRRVLCHVRNLLAASLVTSRSILTVSELDSFVDILGSRSLTLRQKACTIRSQVLHADKPTSKYNERYGEYVRNERLQYRVDDLIAPFLPSGKTVLDVGTGNGLCALRLRTRYGKHVRSFDVCDYRSPEVVTDALITFREARTSPYPAASVDGAVCALVLHHTNPLDTAPLVESVYATLRPGGVLIVLEETPAPSSSEVSVRCHRSDFADLFADLPEPQTLRLLSVMDYISNWVATGNFSVPLTVQFKSIADWVRLMERASFHVKAIDYFGLSRKKFTLVPTTRIVVMKD